MQSRWIAGATILLVACGPNDEPGTRFVGGTSGDIPAGGAASPRGGNSGESSSVTGELSVPVENGESIALRYETMGAADTDREPLVVHFGGPGSSAVDGLPNFVSQLDTETLDALLSRYIFVALDEIGVGGSSPIDCVWSLDPNAVEESALRTSAEAFATECQSEYPFFEELDTARYAEDLDRLRRSLGFERLNFYGYSYGTEVALTYAALFPVNVGRMVLDSPVDPRNSFPELAETQSLGLERALSEFFNFCDRSLDCTFGNGNAERSFDILVQRYSGPAQREAFLGLGTTVLNALYSEEAWPALGSILAQFELSIVVPRPVAISDIEGGIFYGTTCADSPIDSIDEIRAADATFSVGQPLFRPFLYNPLFPCLVWGAESPAIDWSTALPAMRDVLIVGANGDPITPIELADQIEDAIPNANRVDSSAFSHAVGLTGTNACVDSAIVSFLLDDEKTNTSCD